MSEKRKATARRKSSRRQPEILGERGDRQPDLTYFDIGSGVLHVLELKAADPKIIGKVQHALESDRFKWRTIRGISKETGIEDDVVKLVLTSKVPNVVAASETTQRGEALYTTRKHYKNSSSLLERFVGVLKNRAA